GAAVTLQGLHDAASDGVVADDREGADGDRPAELVAHHREHAGDLLAARGPGGGVGGVGVDHAARLLHVRVDVGMGGGGRRGAAWSAPPTRRLPPPLPTSTRTWRRWAAWSTPTPPTSSMCA